MCIHCITCIQKWKGFVSAPRRLRRSVEELVDECGPFAVEQQNIRKHRGNQFMATAIAEPELMLVERLAIFIDAESRLRERSDEHTSELQSLMRLSSAVFCLKKKNTP